MKSNSVFKIYNKNSKSNSSHSIFSIIGNTEPDLTKSLAFLLHYSEDFLKSFLKLMFKRIESEPRFNYLTYSVFAEQLSDMGSINIRRDITIVLKYKVKDPVLIIIEAKNVNKKISTIEGLMEQLNNYCCNNNFSDVNDFKLENIYKATLTKEEIKSKVSNFLSITWEDVIYLLEKLLDKEKFEKDYLLKKFKEELMSSRDIKTYEKEVFCPPCGNSFEKIYDLQIYCCPAEYSQKESIYLLPRIPVNGNEKHLNKNFNINDLKQHSGKGVAEYLYKIEESFIVDINNLDSIENKDLRSKVKEWLDSNTSNNDDEKITSSQSKTLLKVFLLDNCIKLDKPKFTQGQNPSGHMYSNFSELFNQDLILKDS